MGSSIRFAMTLAVLALCAAFSGCAVFAPRLGPDAAVEQAYQKSPTLPNAIAVAESLRGRYLGKVEAQIVAERVTGLALVGMTAIAADLAVRSVSSSEVLGLGIGAAALYTGTNYIVGKPQELIYVAGANAVQCALDAAHPLRIAYDRRDSLERHIEGIELGKRELASRVAEFSGVRLPMVLRAQALVEEATNILPVAREALVVLDNSGGELRSSLAAIQGQVATAIITNSPNLQALLASLGQALPQLGARITGVALPVTAQGAAVKSSGDDDKVEARLGEGVRVLEQLLARLQSIIAAVNARPSAEKLKACNVDLQQAGLTMTVTPTGELTVPAGGSGAFAVAGGVLPYRPATWIGTPPPADQVDLTTETGAGLITVNVKPSAPQGATYALLIRDAAQGRQTATVTIKGAAPQAATDAVTTVKNAAAGAAPACAKDPQVEAIQKKLREAGITAVQVGAQQKELGVDGCYGDVTEAALRQFFKSQGENIADEQIPKDRNQLLKEVAEMLNLAGDA